MDRVVSPGVAHVRVGESVAYCRDPHQVPCVGLAPLAIGTRARVRTSWRQGPGRRHVLALVHGIGVDLAVCVWLGVRLWVRPGRIGSGRPMTKRNGNATRKARRSANRKHNPLLTRKPIV